jgi:hypothetical protein
MHLREPILNLLEQLQLVITDLSDQQYTTPSPLLSNSTIGQHTRHIIEFFSALNNGYDSGIINYDNRRRDYTIESDRHFAIYQLYEIRQSLVKPDKPLLLVAEFDQTVTISTNYFRELLYNLEHIVHHMALMRVAITIPLPESFGVASSTLKFRKACAQ